MSVLHTITQSFFLRQRIGIVRSWWSYNTLIFQISFQKFNLSTVNMIVVISKDDYGTPVVFVECWGGPWWWCWWVDVSEKPTKRRGRTKKLRREEMLNERKRKIQNWQKRIWKVESSSPQQRASRARSPGSGDGQQKTHAQLVPGQQRQRQEAAEEVGGVIRR